MTPTGVLLVQLGTPEAPEPGPVRRYLREFLGDPRVLDIPALAAAPAARARDPAAPAARLGGGVSQDLDARGLAASREQPRGSQRRWRASSARPSRSQLGMRYGEPSLGGALATLCAAGAERILVLPLFPQYAASSTGSALARAAELAAEGWDVPALEFLPPFFDEPGFVAAWAAVAREPLATFRADHVLLSYHGLPERQIKKSDPTGGHCLSRPDCCEAPGAALRRCYRAQCAATSRALALALGLEAGSWSIAFQSRLGRTPWIRPYTDECFDDLAARGAEAPRGALPLLRRRLPRDPRGDRRSAAASSGAPRGATSCCWCPRSTRTRPGWRRWRRCCAGAR